MIDEHIPTRTLQEDVAEDDRPREKALKNGFQTLTNSELLATLIGSGSPGEHVVDLCQRILNDHGNKLYNLARRTVAELTRNYRGVGEVKAIQILAALELSRRYQNERFDKDATIADSRSAYDLLKTRMDHLTHEEVWVLLLSRSKRVLAVERISSGGTASTVVDVKMAVKPAIERLADGMILAHNHPSDTPRPSAQDDALTRKVSEACRAVDIQLLDHIIVCRGGVYYSYSDQGRLP